jgi:hypothetical protein
LAARVRYELPPVEDSYWRSGDALVSALLAKSKQDAKIIEQDRQLIAELERHMKSRR